MPKVEIDDEFRLNIAKELKEKIEKKLQTGSPQNTIYQAQMLSEEHNTDNLLFLSDKIMREKSIPKDLDLPTMGGLLLFMLYSRSQPNIDQRDLAQIEESIDLNDFKGFFRDPNVKALYVNCFDNSFRIFA